MRLFLKESHLKESHRAGEGARAPREAAEGPRVVGVFLVFMKRATHKRASRSKHPRRRTRSRQRWAASARPVPGLRGRIIRVERYELVRVAVRASAGHGVDVAVAVFPRVFSRARLCALQNPRRSFIHHVQRLRG